MRISYYTYHVYVNVYDISLRKKCKLKTTVMVNMQQTEHPN